MLVDILASEGVVLITLLMSIVAYETGRRGWPLSRKGTE